MLKHRFYRKNSPPTPNQSPQGGDLVCGASPQSGELVAFSWQGVNCPKCLEFKPPYISTEVGTLNKKTKYAFIRRLKPTEEYILPWEDTSKFLKNLVNLGTSLGVQERSGKKFRIEIHQKGLLITRTK